MPFDIQCNDQLPHWCSRFCWLRFWGMWQQGVASSLLEEGCSLTNMCFCERKDNHNSTSMWTTTHCYSENTRCFLDKHYPRDGLVVVDHSRDLAGHLTSVTLGFLLSGLVNDVIYVDLMPNSLKHWKFALHDPHSSYLDKWTIVGTSALYVTGTRRILIK
jgi:hypothetical protein